MDGYSDVMTAKGAFNRPRPARCLCVICVNEANGGRNISVCVGWIGLMGLVDGMEAVGPSPGSSPNGPLADIIEVEDEVPTSRRTALLLLGDVRIYWFRPPSNPTSIYVCREDLTISHQCIDRFQSTCTLNAIRRFDWHILSRPFNSTTQRLAIHTHHQRIQTDSPRGSIDLTQNTECVCGNDEPLTSPRPKSIRRGVAAALPHAPAGAMDGGEVEMLAAEVALHHRHGDTAAAAAAKGSSSGNGFVEGGHTKEKEKDEAQPPAGPAALMPQERTARIVITALACVAFLLLGGLGGIIGTCGRGVRGCRSCMAAGAGRGGFVYTHLDSAPTWTKPTTSQTQTTPITPIIPSSHTHATLTLTTQSKPGPSVPALAAELGQRETKLAGIFICRGLGFLTGSFAMTFLVGGWRWLF